MTIATVPLDPRHVFKLGFHSLFVYLEHIGREYNLPSTIVLSANERDDSYITVLRQNLYALDLAVSIKDQKDMMLADTISAALQRLEQRGAIEESRAVLCHCDCGKTQFRSGTEFHRTKEGKTLIDENGQSRCCGSAIQETECDVLFLVMPLQALTVPLCYPSWATIEITESLRQMNGWRLLLSRIGNRTYHFQSASGRFYQIDNDITNILSLVLPQPEGRGIQHLISGVSTVRQVSLMLTVASLLEIELPQSLHFLPRVEFAPVGDIKTLEEAICRFGIYRVKNALLWCALSGSKNIALSGSLFPRMLVSTPPSGDHRSYRKMLLS